MGFKNLWGFENPIGFIVLTISKIMFLRILFISFTILLYGCKISDVSNTNTSTNDETTLTFQPTFGNEKLILNQKYPINQKDSFEINVLRFYISNITFYNNNQLVYKELNSYHLIDLAEKETVQIGFKNQQKKGFNIIKFNLGIDSTTNVSGAFGGDLDPTKGMYWTWQSGYINLKLEGKSELCRTRNNQFQYHLGGYAAPFYALQMVEIAVKNKDEIVVNIDIQHFLNAVDLVNEHSIMSPSKAAVNLAKVAAESFESTY